MTFREVVPAFLCALLAACAGAPREPAKTASGPPPIGAPPPAAVPEKPKPPPFERWANVKSAGARQCRSQVFELGPSYFLNGLPMHVVAGFGPAGGLAAWRAPDQRIAYRVLDATGKPVTPAEIAPAPERFEPHHVVVLERGYVVIGTTSEWMHSRWFAQVLDAGGKPIGSPLELELEHRYIQDISEPKGRSFVVLATRALMVPDDKQDLPGRWLSVEVAPDGQLAQRAADLAFAFPLVRVLDKDFALEIDGAPAWFVERGGEARGELVHDGKIDRLARDELATYGVKPAALAPPGQVDWMTVGTAEGMSFHRVLAGAEIGEPLDVPGVGLLDTPVWSGTRFVIGFTEQTNTAATAAIVAIDCR